MKDTQQRPKSQSIQAIAHSFWACKYGIASLYVIDENRHDIGAVGGGCGKQDGEEEEEDRAHGGRVGQEAGKCQLGEAEL